MTKTPQHETTTDAASPEPTGKKAYQRPTLRVLGAVHLLTRGSGATANGDGGQMMMVASDRAVKQDLVRIGDHPLGIGLYLFTYTPKYRAEFGDGRQFGVMADEVETVMPHAVSRHPDGYQMVDYAMLGITRVVQ